MSSQSQDALTEDELRTLEALLVKLGGRGAELPWPLFRFITEVVATPNVDLLVEDKEKGVLLAWRDDPFGTGWHVPGSIIRHREEIAHRIAMCAQDEFGCSLDVSDGPGALVEIFDDRGHSVSLCFRARLLGDPGKRVRGDNEAPDAGDLRWFKTPPDRFYPSHGVYRDVLVALAQNTWSTGIQVFTQHVGSRDAAQSSPEGAIDPGASLTTGI